MDTRTSVEFIHKNQHDETTLAQVGINRTDARTYLRLYPQFIPNNNQEVK